MAKKNDFLKAFGKSFEIFKKIADAVLAQGGADKDLEQILKDKKLPMNIARIVTYKPERIFSIEVKGAKALSRLSRLYNGHYDEITLEIKCLDQFYDFRDDKVGDFQNITYGAVLIHIDVFRGYSETLTQLGQLGLRPANLNELLAFGATYPDEQRKLPIIALNAFRNNRSTVNEDEFQFPCLDSRIQDKNKPALRVFGKRVLNPFFPIYGINWKILAIRL
ncbi:MAG: hypothetical protein WC499_03720 [Patescibacteria group bacterium]